MFGLLLALLGIVVLIGFLTLGATVGDVLILEADDTAFDATPVILLLVVFYLCVLLGSGIAVSLLYAVGPRPCGWPWWADRCGSGCCGARRGRGYGRSWAPSCSAGCARCSPWSP